LSNKTKMLQCLLNFNTPNQTPPYLLLDASPSLLLRVSIGDDHPGAEASRVCVDMKPIMATVFLPSSTADDDSRACEAESNRATGVVHPDDCLLHGRILTPASGYLPTLRIVNLLSSLYDKCLEVMKQDRDVQNNSSYRR
jgi:hypothetical protein